MSTTIRCELCGEDLRVPDDPDVRQVRCSWCGLDCDVPDASAESISREPLSEPKPDVEPRPSAKPRRADPVENEVYENSLEDDGLPYGVAGGPRQRCPECTKPMEPEAIVCLKCGYNTRTGKKPTERVYEPIKRLWDSDLSLQTRWALFAAGQVVGIATGVGAVSAGHPITAIGSWLLFTAMTAFLCGTWLRLELSRNRKGKVRLVTTWHYFFVPAEPRRHDSDYHQSILTFCDGEVGCFEWSLLLILLAMGIIPGLIWWYLVIHRESFVVSLSAEHGFSTAILYRGLRESLMWDIANTVHDATALPLHQG